MCNALQVENRKLREDWPEKASEINLESELAAMWEENIRLSQAVAQLEVVTMRREETGGANW